MSPLFDLEEYGMIRAGWCVVLEIVNYTCPKSPFEYFHLYFELTVCSSEPVLVGKKYIEDYKIIVRLILCQSL